jgi:hypothetical protein
VPRRKYLNAWHGTVCATTTCAPSRLTATPFGYGRPAFNTVTLFLCASYLRSRPVASAFIMISVLNLLGYIVLESVK